MMHTKVWQLFEQRTLNWVKHVLARDTKGRLAEPNQKNVACVDLIGAIHHVYGRRLHADAIQNVERDITARVVIERVEQYVHCAPLHRWNDAPSTRLVDVIRVCKELNI